MCTQTNQNSPRDINVLLAATTYQGMTDEEIDLIIDYKVERAKVSQEVLATTAAVTLRMEQSLADNRASAQAAQDVLESMVRDAFNPLPVGNPETVTPATVEV